MKKEEVLKRLRNLFPEAESMSIDYYGDGDAFDSFSGLTVWGKKEKVIEKYQTSEYESKFISLTQDYIFTIFDSAVNEPDFNDTGSQGNIYFELLENKVTLSNEYMEWDEYDLCIGCDGEGSNDGDECRYCGGTGDGHPADGSDIKENICDPEVF